MADDDLLSRLGELAREEEQLEPELERLVTGQASEQDLRQLRDRAEQDQALALQVQRMTPLSEVARQRIVAAALGQLSPQQTSLHGRQASRDRERANAAPANDSQQAPQEPLRRGRVLRLSWAAPAALGLAAAATWLLMVRSPAVDALPDYTLTASGSVDAQRGGSTSNARLELTPESRLDLLLRPASDVSGKVELLARVHADGDVTRLQLAPQVAASGALRVRVSALDVFGSRRGDARLELIACRPEQCEQALRESQNGAERGAGWERLELPLHLPAE